MQCDAVRYDKIQYDAMWYNRVSTLYNMEHNPILSLENEDRKSHTQQLYSLCFYFDQPVSALRAFIWDEYKQKCEPYKKTD